MGTHQQRNTVYAVSEMDPSQIEAQFSLQTAQDQRLLIVHTDSGEHDSLKDLSSVPEQPSFVLSLIENNKTCKKKPDSKLRKSKQKKQASPLKSAKKFLNETESEQSRNVPRPEYQTVLSNKRRTGSFGEKERTASQRKEWGADTPQ
jgi:hypothetical protein